jgi:hypothetical protein
MSFSGIGDARGNCTEPFALLYGDNRSRNAEMAEGVG